MIIVSDTTPISELAKVGYLDLLPQLFGKVVIPQGVFNELPENQGIKPLHSWRKKRLRDGEVSSPYPINQEKKKNSF